MQEDTRVSRIILRFRDLVTEEGGTVAEHTALLRQFGEVWWGWWMRPYESVPRLLFTQLAEAVEKEGPVKGYLFDSGTSRLYSASLAGVSVAPPGDRVSTPDPRKTPSYYHRGTYPAWFLLNSISEVDFSTVAFWYDSFPTKPEEHATLAQLLGQRVFSLEQLRHIDVTLWVVQAAD